MGEDNDTTRRFSSERQSSSGHPNARTLDDLFEIIQSLHRDFTAHRTEFVEFRDKVDARLLKSTTPLGDTLVAIQLDVSKVQHDLSEIIKTNRRLESKVDGISINHSEMKGALYDHEKRLQTLEA